MVLYNEHKFKDMDTRTSSIDPSMVTTAVNTTNSTEPSSVANVKNTGHSAAITLSSSCTESFNNTNHTTLVSRTDEKSLSDQIFFGDIQLDPPISTMERYRDVVLRGLDLPIFQYIGIFVMLGVVVDGAIFFFLLIGLHTLCHPVTDCEPRNTVYNISIQILNGFFTYMALLSLPWRLSNFLHLSKNVRNRWYCCRNCYPLRSNEIGHNLYGLADSDIWFHIPVNRR